ncbi:MAG: UDP-glucose--hexose-1-phosphate uridylyltransferase [Terriglobales bacterium]
MNLAEQPHRRWNALTSEWVLVSPHRTGRPWQGQVEKSTIHAEPAYDPSCYLCPGNSRAGGVHNPQYTGTFVFDNDYAALMPGALHEHSDVGGKGLLIAKSESGICRVICFSPRHDLTLATMQPDEITEVVRTWTGQFRELGQMPEINYVQIFENRGALMGASNPHPHCQIWATATIPEISAREGRSQLEYFVGKKSCLLCDYCHLEEEQKLRIVGANDSFLTVVPFWAVWPFEVLVCSRRHFGTLLELTEKEIVDLAQTLHRITSTYDRVFHTPFPYSMGFHQAPSEGDEHPEWHFHAHFYPPLLRSATVRKFMVGFEMLGTPQRDITPEIAAAHLRSLCPE